MMKSIVKLLLLFLGLLVLICSLWAIIHKFDLQDAKLILATNEFSFSVNLLVLLVILLTIFVIGAVFKMIKHFFSWISKTNAKFHANKLALFMFHENYDRLIAEYLSLDTNLGKENSNLLYSKQTLSNLEKLPESKEKMLLRLSLALKNNQKFSKPEADLLVDYLQNNKSVFALNIFLSALQKNLLPSDLSIISILENYKDVLAEKSEALLTTLGQYALTSDKNEESKNIFKIWQKLPEFIKKQPNFVKFAFNSLYNNEKENCQKFINICRQNNYCSNDEANYFEALLI